MMKDLLECIQESKNYINSIIKTQASHAIILGTGLNEIGSGLVKIIEIPYSNIPHFPVTTVQSHEGRLIFGYLFGIPLILMSGRFHYYEGYSSKELTFPIRVLKALGIRHLIITNASGGINPHYREGDIVIIKDHINMMPDHPLRGKNDERIGLRFPDMMHAYDPHEINNFFKLSKKSNIHLHSGVYLGLQGPSLETPAEYKMAHILGADVVGMSLIPEVIVARHESIKVSAFSIVSNVCFPISNITPTSIDEVIAVVNTSALRLQRLLYQYFQNLHHVSS